MSRALLLLLLILSLYVLDSKKKPKKDKRPHGTEPELYCNSCQAIVREALKKLKHRTSEPDVFEALEGICEMNNLYVYDYPPPQMNKACLDFMEIWAETIEKELGRRNGNSEIEDKLCLKTTKACEGVDMEAKKEERRKKNAGIQVDKVPGGFAKEDF